jgi:hypothetical protein
MKSIIKMWITVLQLVAFINESLPLELIAEIITVDLDKDPWFSASRRLREFEDLPRMYGSLLALTQSPKDSEMKIVVTTGHSSVQEYLKSPRILNGKAYQFALSYETSIEFIANFCVSYLMSFGNTGLRLFHDESQRSAL